MSHGKPTSGCEWHLEFPYTPDFPYPFPIVPAGTRAKHNAVGHLASDGTVHVYNSQIVERLVRAGLRTRACAAKNGTNSDCGNGV
jgi:hypothetical protein